MQAEWTVPFVGWLAAVLFVLAAGCPAVVRGTALTLSSASQLEFVLRNDKPTRYTYAERFPFIQQRLQRMLFSAETAEVLLDGLWSHADGCENAALQEVLCDFCEQLSPEDYEQVLGLPGGGAANIRRFYFDARVMAMFGRWAEFSPDTLSRELLLRIPTDLGMACFDAMGGEWTSALVELWMEERLCTRVDLLWARLPQSFFTRGRHWQNPRVWLYLCPLFVGNPQAGLLDPETLKAVLKRKSVAFADAPLDGLYVPYEPAVAGGAQLATFGAYLEYLFSADRLQAAPKDASRMRWIEAQVVMLNLAMEMVLIRLLHASRDRTVMFFPSEDEQAGSNSFSEVASILGDRLPLFLVPWLETLLKMYEPSNRIFGHFDMVYSRLLMTHMKLGTKFVCDFFQIKAAVVANVLYSGSRTVSFHQGRWLDAYGPLSNLISGGQEVVYENLPVQYRSVYRSVLWCNLYDSDKVVLDSSSSDLEAMMDGLFSLQNRTKLDPADFLHSALEIDLIAALFPSWIQMSCALVPYLLMYSSPDCPVRSMREAMGDVVVRLSVLARLEEQGFAHDALYLTFYSYLEHESLAAFWTPGLLAGSAAQMQAQYFSLLGMAPDPMLEQLGLKPAWEPLEEPVELPRIGAHDGAAPGPATAYPLEMTPNAFQLVTDEDRDREEFAWQMSFPRRVTDEYWLTLPLMDTNAVGHYDASAEDFDRYQMAHWIAVAKRCYTKATTDVPVRAGRPSGRAQRLRQMSIRAGDELALDFVTSGALAKCSQTATDVEEPTPGSASTVYGLAKLAMQRVFLESMFKFMAEMYANPFRSYLVAFEESSVTGSGPVVDTLQVFGRLLALPHFSVLTAIPGVNDQYVPYPLLDCRVMQVLGTWTALSLKRGLRYPFTLAPRYHAYLFGTTRDEAGTQALREQIIDDYYGWVFQLVDFYFEALRMALAGEPRPGMSELVEDGTWFMPRAIPAHTPFPVRGPQGQWVVRPFMLDRASFLRDLVGGESARAAGGPLFHVAAPDVTNRDAYKALLRTALRAQLDDGRRYFYMGLMRHVAPFVPLADTLRRMMPYTCSAITADDYRAMVGSFVYEEGSGRLVVEGQQVAEFFAAQLLGSGAELDEALLGKLLWLVTGLTNAPLEGFRSRPIRIIAYHANPPQLLSASTCFFTLKLPLLATVAGTMENVRRSLGLIQGFGDRENS